MAELEAVVSAVASARKYRALCEDTVLRAAAREIAASPGGGLRAVVKATKRRLHQAYGAFETELDAGAAYRTLEAAYRSRSQQAIHAACREVMEHHQSTRERLPILEGFYPAIWALTGPPRAVLDLGCGLNPLALPWMGLAAGCRYVPIDIDCERVAFLNRALGLAGREPLARWQDLLADPPGDAASVALLLKMSPTLERQEAGATGRLIEGLRADWAVVSFAVRSLGGREKGMAEQYRRQFLRLAGERGWPVESLVFETELVFVVQSARGGVGLLEEPDD